MESALDLKWPFAKRYLNSRSWPVSEVVFQAGYVRFQQSS